MLVDEDGHDPVRAPQHRDRFVEEPLARVEVLPLLVLRIDPMLADDQHAVYRQLAGPQRQRLFDGSAEPEAVPFREIAAHVGLRELIDVETDKLKVRLAAVRVQVLALEQAAQDHVGVGVVVIDGGDPRDPLRQAASSHRR